MPLGAPCLPQKANLRNESGPAMEAPLAARETHRLEPVGPAVRGTDAIRGVSGRQPGTCRAPRWKTEHSQGQVKVLCSGEHERAEHVSSQSVKCPQRFPSDSALDMNMRRRQMARTAADANCSKAGVVLSALWIQHSLSLLLGTCFSYLVATMAS